MDDEKKLVAQLQAKLAELDVKVANFRQDMRTEFQRYTDTVLVDVPKELSRNVLRTIAASISNYTSLSTPSRDGSESPSGSADRRAWDGRRSPPPILYHTSGTPKDGPRSPRQRERDLHGLFTPSYLPLLDRSDQPEKSPNPSPPASPGPTVPTLVTNFETIQSVDEVLGADAAREAIRPHPIRRLTDGTASSLDSTGSDAKARRSALRRSSSSAKGSPRRVRFDFEGKEVLPTASPQVSVIPLVSLGEISVPVSAIVDDSQPYTGTSLLDVEGEEDSLPRPKKVSSTQALRALSRNPLDESTEWTVVNPDPSESPTMNGRDEKPQPTPSKTAAAVAVPRAAAETVADVRAKSSRASKTAVVDQPRREQILGKPIEQMAEDDDNDDSDDEFLSMGPKKKKASRSLAPPSPGPRSSLPTSPGPRSPLPRSSGSKERIHRTTKDNAKVAAAEPAKAGATTSAKSVVSKVGASKSNKSSSRTAVDDDELFDFDDGGDAGLANQQRPRKQEKFLMDSETDEDSDTDDHEPAVAKPLAAAKVPMSIPSRSPETGPLTPTSAKFAQGSIGSYKGNSLRMNVVVDPKVQEAASAMDDFDSFVGGVDGRSGVDASDLNSFRASVTRPTYGGTPRSFSDKMALEELAEAMKGRTGRGKDEDN